MTKNLILCEITFLTKIQTYYQYRSQCGFIKISLHYNIQTLNSLHWFFRRKISKLQPHRTFSRSRSNITIIREWSIEPIDLLRVMIAHLETGESEKLVSGK